MCLCVQVSVLVCSGECALCVQMSVLVCLLVCSGECAGVFDCVFS